MNNFLIACMYQILFIYQLSNNSMFVPDITELEVALDQDGCYRVSWSYSFSLKFSICCKQDIEDISYQQVI